MSLKAFHIVFIIVSSLTAFGSGAWCFAQYSVEPSVGYLAGGLMSMAAGVSLIGYGRWFLKKLEGVNYI